MARSELLFKQYSPTEYINLSRRETGVVTGIRGDNQLDTVPFSFYSKKLINENELDSQLEFALDVFRLTLPEFDLDHKAEFVYFLLQSRRQKAVNYQDLIIEYPKFVLRWKNGEEVYSDEQILNLIKLNYERRKLLSTPKD